LWPERVPSRSPANFKPAEVAMRSALLAAVLFTTPLLWAFPLIAFSADRPAPLLTLSGSSGHVRAVTYNADGRLVAAVGADHAVCIWNTETGELLHRLTGHAGEVRSIAFSINSNLLLSAGTAPDGGEVRIWNARNGSLFRQYSYPSAVNSVAGGPRNTFAVACADGLAEHRYNCTGNVIVSQRLTDQPLQLVGFGPDESLYAFSGGHAPTMWNVVDGTLLAECGRRSFAATEIALSPDASIVATAGVSELKLWNIATGELIASPPGIHGHTYGIAFSADGLTLITGGNNCHSRPENGQRRVELYIWDVQRGERTLAFPEGLPLIWSVALSPDGAQVAIGTREGTIQVHSLTSALAATEVP
jgi:WD40 repeat protein